MTEWVEEWPTTAGSYWFYGWPFSDRKSAPKMHFVEVCTNSRGEVAMIVTNGHFLYKAEGAYGLWQKVVLPEVPNLTDEI